VLEHAFWYNGDQNMRDLLGQLYRTKMVLSCLILITSGTVLMVAGHQVDHFTGWSWLKSLPFGELGGILFGAGVLSVWLDHFLLREQTELDELRLRRLLHDQAPVMRDAVLEAFAANQDDLKRVATPETLDRIISNSLALRLDDQQFASEVYADIRDQAVGASERWYDASLSIGVSNLPALRGTAGGRTPHHPGGGLFAVTVRWEYTVVPRHAQRRFVCLSDRDEYVEVAAERGATSAWYLKPEPGIDAGAQEAFELVRFAVNGEERSIRRTARKNSQAYTATVGAEHVEAGETVTIAYTYRTITPKDAHLLFFDIEQPTRDLRVDFDYTNTDIRSVSTIDLIPSVRPTRIGGTKALARCRVRYAPFDDESSCARRQRRA
jgi:hypothetical protein